MRIWGATLAILGFLCACSSVKVQTDHDPDARFSEYHTYLWTAQTGPQQTPPDISGVPSPLIEKRVRSAVDAQLPQKGLRPAAPGEVPDLLLNQRIVQKEKVESSPISLGGGVGFGSGGGGSFGTFGTGISSGGGWRKVTEGSLVLDLIDAKTNALVWRGIGSNVSTEPGRSAERIQEVVTKTLEKYPPA